MSLISPLDAQFSTTLDHIKQNANKDSLAKVQAQGNELICISAMATVAQEANPTDLYLLKKIANKTDFPKETTDGARAIISTLAGEDNIWALPNK